MADVQVREVGQPIPLDGRAVRWSQRKGARTLIEFSQLAAPRGHAIPRSRPAGCSPKSGARSRAVTSRLQPSVGCAVRRDGERSARRPHGQDPVTSARRPGQMDGWGSVGAADRVWPGASPPPVRRPGEERAPVNAPQERPRRRERPRPPPEASSCSRRPPPYRSPAVRSGFVPDKIVQEGVAEVRRSPGAR